MKNNEKGSFTNYLTSEEVSFTQRAAIELSKVDWANKFLKDGKIRNALKAVPNPNRSYAELNEIKSAYFEIRFAFAICNEKLKATYELPCGIGNSTVDFKIINGYEWFIELTSFRESLAIKENTQIDSDSFSCLSLTKLDENSPEVRDIIKTQAAICRKVSQSEDFKIKGDPIKFPEVSPNSYHMVLVDMRSFNMNGASFWDCWNIAFGSEALAGAKDDNVRIHYKEWTEKGKRSFIKGLFDDQHPDARSSYIRERIHLLGFISEKKYSENEIVDEMKIFCNPRFFEYSSELQKIFPFKEAKLFVRN